MRRFDRYSIKWRLFGYLVLFIAIPVALLWFFQIVFLEQFYTTIKLDDVERSVETIVSSFEDELVSSADMTELIDHMASANDVSIRLYDEGGDELYISDFGPESGVPLDTGSIQQYYMQAEDADGQVLRYFDPTSPKEKETDQKKNPLQRTREPRSIVYARLVPTPEGRDVLLVTSAMITPVEATVRTLRVQLVYITLILLALSLFLAVLMSQRISRPIIQTTASASQLAKGEYDTVFDAHGYLEIAELNKTLNFAASEMSKVERLRHDLIANVSHDLRTPLTMIVGYAEMMRDIPGENTQKNAQVIVDEARRLSHLVSDMLDISQLQSGGQDISPQRCNLTKLLRELMERYERFAEQQGYHIAFEAGEDVYVHCDAGRLEQVVYNLMNNAVNYTGEDRQVTLRQRVSDGHVRIEVEDTGEGIPKEDLPYIWDRYYKVDQAHKRAPVGTGLGLSIVRTVLELHDAEYGVQSEVGKGSNFWFELPLDTGEAKEES